VHAAGEQVRKGDRLFQFYSPELVNAQEEFLQAFTARDTRLVELSRQRLAVLGVPRSVVESLERDGKVHQRLPIYATQDGVLADLNVREGMYVQRDMDVMTLADLASVWVLVDVFEQQVAWVREGQPAEVRLASVPDRQWQGRVEYIYPDVDPQTRTLRVRLRFANPGGELKPNMYAQATIQAEPRRAVSVPRDAVIRTEHGAHVILAQGEGRFQPAPIKPGIEAGDRVEVLEGVQEGDRVVVSAQFLIDSEASLRAALRRMTAPAPATEVAAFEATGVINKVDESGRTLNLNHDPIPALGWPAMTMDFTVGDGVTLHGIAPGTRVEFQLRRVDPTSYEITALRTTGGAQ
jgi:Cu(I)/Ag(I) efflux system membrane fusion protein